MKTLSFAFVASLVLALGSNTVHSATIIWTNAASGNWNAPINWSPNQVPLAADNAVITNSGTYTVTLNVSASVASLTLGGTSGTQSFVQNANTLTLNGASTVGTNGSFNLGGGTLNGAGSFTVNGLFTWSGGQMADTGGMTLNGASTLNGSGFASMQLDGLLINNGALTWGGSGANLYFSNGTLTNLAAGTITITADVSTADGGGINVFGNAGLLRKTGGTGTTAMGVPFVNTGDVQVQSGTFNVTEGGSASGTFEVSANTLLQFGNGTYTLSLASSVTGAGNANFSGGTVNAGGTYNLIGTNTFSGGTANFSGNYAITNRPVTISAAVVNFNAGGTVKLTGLTLSSGTLGGTLPVPVNGPFTWSGGILADTGGMTLNGASTLNGPGFASMQLDGLLINNGALTWGGSGANLYFSNGTLTNLAAGTITITADVSTADGGGINVFGNAGLLRKTGGTGTTAMGVPFVNTGDVQVQSGTFNVTEGGSASGTFEVSANTLLQFGNGTYTLSLASSVTGAGNANFSGGTVNAGGTYNLIGTNTFSGGTANFSGNYAITNRPVTISAAVVNFNAGGTVKLTGLTLSSGTLGGTLPVPVNGPFTWSGGILADTGGMTLNGASTLNGPGFASMQLDGLLINNGALTWGGSGANLYFSNGTLTNLAAGTITVTADVSTADGGGVNVFGNAGLLRKTGGTGTTAMGVPFVNTGDVQVQSGTFNVTEGGSASGTFEVSANTLLKFGGSGTYTLSLASSVTGAGNANFSGGTVNAGGTYNLIGTNTFSGGTANFSGNYAITNRPVTISAAVVNFNAGGTVKLTGLTLSSGTLGGTLPVPVNGPFTWSGGILADTGGMTLNGASTLNGPGFASMQLDGLLINNGALTWGGSGANLYFSNGTLTNLAAGTITITADVSTADGGGVNVFGNAGLLRKTAGTGTTAIVVRFVNSGTLDAQNGNIALQGAFTLANSTKMSFGLGGSTGNGSISLSGAASFSGSLSVNFNNFFWPVVGSSFNLLNYTSESGVLFTNVTLPATVNFTWQTNYNSTAFALSVIARTGTNLVSTNLFLSKLNSTSLILQWPGDHTGWSIQAQTNPATMGLGTNWSVLTGSSLTNQFVMPIGKTNDTVFFRMAYP